MSNQTTSSRRHDTKSYPRTDTKSYPRTDSKSYPRTDAKIVLAPLRYKLTKLSPAQTLTQISARTQGFYDLSINSADWIQRDIRSREFSSFGSYPAPRERNLVEEIVGEDNYYLHLTMKKHNIAYICYDEDKSEFHLWGEYQCCIRALNELRYRLEKIKTRRAPITAQPVPAVPVPAVPVPDVPVPDVPVPDVVDEEPTTYFPSSPSYSPMSPSYCPTTPPYDLPESFILTEDTN